MAEEADTLEVGGFLFHTSVENSTPAPSAVLQNKYQEHLAGSDSEEEAVCGAEDKKRPKEIVVKPKLDVSSDENWDGESDDDDDRDEEFDAPRPSKRPRAMSRSSEHVRKKRRLNASDGDGSSDDGGDEHERLRKARSFKKKDHRANGDEGPAGSAAGGIWKRKEHPVGGDARPGEDMAKSGSSLGSSLSSSISSSGGLGASGNGAAGWGRPYGGGVVRDGSYEEHKIKMEKKRLEMEMTRVREMKEQVEREKRLLQQQQEEQRRLQHLKGIDQSLPSGATPHYPHPSATGLGASHSSAGSSQIRSSTADPSDPKKRFKAKASSVVVDRVTLHKAKIKTKKDFKHLCRKLTHTVVEKEQKKNPQFFVNDKTIRKIEKFVDDFFAKISADQPYHHKD